MKIARAVGAAVGIAVLAGCVQAAPTTPSATIPHDAPSGGQTAAELAATVASIDGLELEGPGCTEPNVKGETGCSWTVRLAPGYQLLDRVALVDFLVESAWSVRDGYQPNTSIQLGVHGDPADPFSMADVVVDAGWSDRTEPGQPMAENGFTMASVWLVTDAMPEEGGAANLARLGAWPGDAPPVPDDLVTPIVP